mmetsp:Transcript_20275/g.47159  ORF Transcript_20275/g.47159 Transcript_20275/m.47159 type:complete len:321 (+) Transcript_20275:148-1110(+)
MSQAKVLYIHITSLSSEVIKNLVLAGIRPAICDLRRVKDHQTFLKQTPCFFWSPLEKADDDTNEPQPPNQKRPKLNEDERTIAELVQPFIQDLNPLLGDCQVVPHGIADLTAEILQEFSVIVASHVTPTDLVSLAGKLSQQQKLIWMDSFGWHGSAWMDLGPEHTYRPEQGKELLDPTVLKPYVSMKEMYSIPLHKATNRFHKKTPPPSLVYHKTILAFVDSKKAWPETFDPEEFVKFVRESWLPDTSPSLLDHDLFREEALKQLAKQATVEMIPVCSVAGGMVGNEIIKAISGKGTPANNTVLFEGTTCKGWYFLLKEK